MNKCSGCGVILQNKNIDELGYTKNIESLLCERCFRIINYNEYKEVIKDSNDFIEILNKIKDTNDLVLIIVDLFNINKIEHIIKNLPNDKIIVLTKKDLLPKLVKDQKLIDYVKTDDKTIKDFIVISSNKNYNFDELLDKINYHKKTKNVYVVGFTNAGKSTMINKLIYNYSNFKTVITTSLLQNTTVDLIEVSLDENLTLIDTPGILDKGNIINKLDKNEIKRLLPKKEIKPVTYQMKKSTVLLIDNFLRIDSLTDVNLTFFISNSFEINRFYKTEKLKDFESQIIDVMPNEDIVINGLGFIKVTKKGRVKISTFKDVEIYKRKSLI